MVITELLWIEDDDSFRATYRLVSVNKNISIVNIHLGNKLKIDSSSIAIRSRISECFYRIRVVKREDDPSAQSQLC